MIIPRPHRARRRCSGERRCALPGGCTPRGTHGRGEKNKSDFLPSSSAGEGGHRTGSWCALGGRHPWLAGRIHAGVGRVGGRRRRRWSSSTSGRLVVSAITDRRARASPCTSPACCSISMRGRSSCHYTENVRCHSRRLEFLLCLAWLFTARLLTRVLDHVVHRHTRTTQLAGGNVLRVHMLDNGMKTLLVEETTTAAVRAVLAAPALGLQRRVRGTIACWPRSYACCHSRCRTSCVLSSKRLVFPRKWT